MKRFYALRQIGILDAPFVVVFDNLLKRLEAAVVHVRGGMLDLAQVGVLNAPLSSSLWLTR